MKRHITLLALVSIVALVAVALTACGMSNNPKATKQTLEEKNYSVEATIGDNDLEAQAELDSMSDEMKITAGELVAMIAATKGGAGQDTAENFVYIYYFKDSKVADKFWTANKTELDALKTEYKDFDGFEIGKDGSVVYFGTKQAIKDAQ